MYFTEFEFCLTNVPDFFYWFPVLIDSTNVEYAGAVKNGIITRLTKKFKLLKTCDLVKYERPFYSETLKSLVENQQKGAIEKLSLKALTIGSFEREIRITLSNQYQIVPQMLLAGHLHTITNKLNKRGFLTTQFHTDTDYEKEFLVMKLEQKDIHQDDK
ncbi:MAG: hypothetical protein ACXVBZ_11845 [Flavisolibacter sp.]